MRQLIPAIASLLCWLIVAALVVAASNDIEGGDWLSLSWRIVPICVFMHFGEKHYRRAVSS